MPHSAYATPEVVDRLVAYFENLSPQHVSQLGALYAPQARFVDPFNEVVGLQAIEGIFSHMFEALEAPRFVVTTRIVQGSQCFLTWEFRFQFKRFHKNQNQTILGGSHLVFGTDGRVTLHRDYWDAAAELYEKLPVVGGLMRWLKKRANS
ncbi:MAG: isomerase [Burkholderiales bacterium PBB4]|nr:MAG: isomerase [Burkholderiales bacterium PBB4]